MFYDDTSDSDNPSSSVSDILDSLVQAGSTAYETYTLSSQGITPIPGQPGAYVQQTAAGPKIVTPVQDSLTKNILVLGFFGIVAIGAFKLIK